MVHFGRPPTLDWLSVQSVDLRVSLLLPWVCGTTFHIYWRKWWKISCLISTHLPSLNVEQKIYEYCLKTHPLHTSPSFVYSTASFSWDDATIKAWFLPQIICHLQSQPIPTHCRPVERWTIIVWTFQFGVNINMYVKVNPTMQLWTGITRITRLSVKILCNHWLKMTENSNNVLMNTKRLNIERQPFLTNHYCSTY